MKSRNTVTGGWIIVILILIFSCRPKEIKKEEPMPDIPVVIDVPEFSADSAYGFVSTQVAFGPRIPSTGAHKKCAVFLENKLKSYGANVIIQPVNEEAYNGQVLELYNIIASFQPQKTKRILLAAHWDTRPFSDKDPLLNKHPFDGANDGASGVGVLLEIARIFSEFSPPNVGVDIILFDGEDYGEPEFEDEQMQQPQTGKLWWCLGSQYWAKNRHIKNYSAYYGILLDMVGAKNARFYKEGGSVQFAKKIVNKVWERAHQSGYGDFFINAGSPGITDDHIFINRDAKIPTIVIVDYDPSREDSYFPAYHHTQNDNMSIIDPVTLKAVGQTVLNVIYYE